MSKIQQQMAEVITTEMHRYFLEAAAYGQSEPYDPFALPDKAAAAILAMPEVKALVDAMAKISDPLLNYRASVSGTAGAIQIIRAIAVDAKAALQPFIGGDDD